MNTLYRASRLLLLSLLVVTVVHVDAAQRSLFGQEATLPENAIRQAYQKFEYMIPMRDGVKLHTAVYVPRDTSKKYPILMKRTPYSCSPYGAEKYPASLGPSNLFPAAGYIFVNQDVRGRFLSEGTFEQVTPHNPNKQTHKDIDESSDTYDTIEWLLSNVTNHNGRVGMYGISYPGFYCSAGMIDSHPALIAVSPQAPVGDWYFDDFLHNGAFFLAHAYRWLNNNAQERRGPSTERVPPKVLPTLDGYELFLRAGTIEEINRQFLNGEVPFWNDMMAHPNRDEFWQKRAILPHLKRVSPHVMVVTGWYDAEDLYGSFKTYQSVESQNPNVNNVLVVGPWHHGGWASTEGDKLGPVSFGSKTAVYYREKIELPFFEKYLKDADLPAPAEATVFETGSNTWRTFAHWPPQETKAQTWYFHEKSSLSLAAPQQKDGIDSYLSDPAKPVPYTETITSRMTIEYMVEDQRFAGRRPDVLVYQTEPFTEDCVIAGPIKVKLWVTNSNTDADFVVKLIDVHPDSTHPADQPNFQGMLRSEVLRGKFRNSFEKPEPFIPGKPTEIEIELLDVLHRFKPGHRMMIQVQSTWFPLVDRNPQKYIPNIYFAKPEDFEKANIGILRSDLHSSRIEVGVLK